VKYPHLLSQIIRGKWLLDPQTALSYFPLIDSLLQGKVVELDGEPEYKIQAISPRGESFSVYDDAPEGSIAIVSLRGTMVKEDSWCDVGTETIAANITEAFQHKNISALILKTNSGGGAVDAVPPMLDAIKSSTKPIVSFVDDMAASAAYYVASHTNSIIASNDISAMIGSIGVMIQFADYQEYYKSKGIKVHTVYAPESTAKNQAFEEALKGNYELIQKELLSPLAQKFQAAIRESRKGKLDETVEGVMAGKMFFADDALKAGLIDSIGNFDTALALANQLAAKQVINNYNF
jgi:protease IV